MPDVRRGGQGRLRSDDGEGLPSLRPLILPLSGLLIAQFTMMLSGTVIGSALPTLMGSLEGPHAHAAWMIAATILGNAATTPIWGKLADRVNPKHILLFGMTLFLVATAGAGFSVNTSTLLVFRSLQGVSFGASLSAITVVVATVVAARQRGRVNAWFTSAQTTAVIAGPALGGLIVETPGLGWQWCFFLLLPLGAVAMGFMIFALRLVDPTPPGVRLDLGGAALLASGLVGVLIAVTALGQGAERSDVLILVSGVYGVLALVAAVFVELRVADPILPLRLMANPTMILSVIASLLAGTMFFVGTVYVTQYAQFAQGLSPARSGLIQIPMAVLTIVATLLAGRYMSATARVKPVLIVGMLSLLLGAAVLVFLNSAFIPVAIGGTMLVGIGLGATMQNLLVAPQNRAPIEHIGSISATILFVFTLGGAAGLVVFGAILDSIVERYATADRPIGDAYGDGIPIVFVIETALMAVATLCVLFMPTAPLKSSIEPREAWASGTVAEIVAPDGR
jgi:MFS family permease